VPDDEFMQREHRPLAWDATSRARLRRDAEAANVNVELQRCQRINDYSLKYLAPSSARKRSSTNRP
jgi:hypothetical protein